MEEETTNNPAPETPQELVADAPEAEAEIEEPETADDAAEGDEIPDEEFEEFESDGKVYKVPKELVPRLMKNADYTQKTQALSAEKEAWRAEREREAAEISADREMIEIISQKSWIDNRLSQFQGVDWQQWFASDPQGAGAAQAEYAQLRDARSDLDQQVNARQEQIAAHNQARMVEVQRQAIETLSKPDPNLGWSGKFDSATNQKLTSFLRDVANVPENVIPTVTDPTAIKIIHLAMLGHQTMQKQRAASTQPKVSANPVPQVGTGKTRSTVDPDKLPIDQWMKREQERMRAKARSR